MSSNTSGENTSQETSNGGGFPALKQHVLENKISTFLWATRILTILFTFSYIVPIFSPEASSYQKVLLCNVVISALRLHQRVPSVELSLACVSRIFLEDSAHFLTYSIIFMNTAPITLVLVPIFLFAVLNCASYTLILLDVLGSNNALGVRFIISFVELQQLNMLRITAAIEIMLMPLVVFLVLMGKVGLLTPILYYRFLTMRYSSRRNAYTRNIFYELRVMAETAANKPYIPSILRMVVHRTIASICSFAPQVPQS